MHYPLLRFLCTCTYYIYSIPSTHCLHPSLKQPICRFSPSPPPPTSLPARSMKFTGFSFSLAVFWITGVPALYLPQEVASPALISPPLRKRFLPVITEDDVLSRRQAREKPGPFYVALNRRVRCWPFSRKNQINEADLIV